MRDLTNSEGLKKIVKAKIKLIERAPDKMISFTHGKILIASNTQIACVEVQKEIEKRLAKNAKHAPEKRQFDIKIEFKPEDVVQIIFKTGFKIVAVQDIGNR